MNRQTNAQVLNPNQLAVIQDGSGSIPNFSGVTSVFVLGNYAYVANFYGNSLEVVDITIPGLPAHKGIIYDGTGGARLRQAYYVYVSGNYAYVGGADGIEIVDVSNPSNPTHFGFYASLNSISMYFSGNYSYVGNSGGVTILDFTDPANPVRVGSFSSPGSVQSMYVSGSYLYVSAYKYSEATGPSGAVQVVDISDPSNPLPKGTLNDGDGGTLLKGAGAIHVSGKYAYVCSVGYQTTNGLEIIDISDPSHPVHKGSLIDGTGGAKLQSGSGVYVSNGYAYVSSYNLDALEIVDVTDPSHPVHKSSLSDGDGGAFLKSPGAICVVNNYVYVGCSSALTIVDVSNPSNPVHKGSLLEGGGGAQLKTANAVFVSGKYAYVASPGSDALEIVDVSDPSKPLHKSSLTDGQGGALLNFPLSVYVSGNYAYVASTQSNALEIVDISNPANPVHKGSLTSQISSPTCVFVAGNYAYVGSYGAFQVVDIGNPSSPALVGTLLDGQGGARLSESFYSIYVSGNYAYVASSSSSALEIIDVTNPANPLHKGSISNGAGGALLSLPFSVQVSGNYAYVASFANDALEIVDISDPANPTHKSSVTDGQGGARIRYPQSVYVSGKYAFVGSGGGLEIIDVSNPANPVHKSYLADQQNGAVLTGTPSSLFVSGNYVYSASNEGALSIIYLYTPLVSGSKPGTGEAGSVITISGKNFNTFCTAAINGIPLKINSVSDSTLSCILPPQITNGKISVNYKGLNTFSHDDFLVIPESRQASNIGQNIFTANWSDVKPAFYLLDVSTDSTFSNLVYSDHYVGKGTSYQLTSLSPGTVYYYRIKSVQGSSGGPVKSGNSRIIKLTTIPDTPEPYPPGQITQSGFTASWKRVNRGVNNYFFDVAKDQAFTNLVPGYNNVSVFGSFTSQVVSGLNPGTYYYRVRAGNVSGTSPNSPTITAVTIPATPVAMSASAVTTNGFTINWEAAVGGDSYLLDLSRDNFVTFEPGYNAVNVGPTTSKTITGIGSGTAFQYRVRATNGSGTSPNSNVISVLTLTPTPAGQPGNLIFSNLTSTSINVSFSPAPQNPNGYLVLRSTALPASSAPASGVVYTVGTNLGNATVAYSGAATSFVDGGLQSSLRYYYSIYAYNGSGNAINYLTAGPLQGSVLLDVTPPQISEPVVPNPETISSGTPVFSAVITDNVGVESARIYYRGIAGTNFKSAPLTPTGTNNYSIQIQSSWYDSLGMEYYFMATDVAGNTTSKPSTSKFSWLVSPTISLPQLPYGDDAKSYRIVAFPYSLPGGNDVTKVYPNIPWNDNAKSGLWWWNPANKNGAGGYDRFNRTPTLQTVDPGKGYWLITSVPSTPQLANVPSPRYNKSNLFSMVLKPGWNQIGNPYPTPISWDDVIAMNKKLNPSALFSKLTLYDGTGLKEATDGRLLNAYEGGFVKNLTSSDITIQIPFNGQVNAGGRQRVIGSDLTEDKWNIFLHIQQGGMVNELGGFGMHPEATIGEDVFDSFNPPRFLDIPEIRFSSKASDQSISNDMVPRQENHQWRFTVTGSIGEKAELNWNSGINTNSYNELYLLDEEKLTLINMSMVSSYSFTLTKKTAFRIFFGRNVPDEISTEEIIVSDPSPNPISGDLKTSILVSLPQTGAPYLIQMKVYSMQGVELGNYLQSQAWGVRQLHFNLNGLEASGVYVYRLLISSGNRQGIYTGKIIKQ